MYVNHFVAGIIATYLSLLISLVQNTQKKNNILNIFNFTQKHHHFFSGVYTIWEEIRHSNTHKDMDTCNCVQRYVKKNNNFFPLSSLDNWRLNSVLDQCWIGWSNKSQKRRNFKRRTFFKREIVFEAILLFFFFIANPLGLLLAASCCLFQFAIKEGNKSPHNRSDQLQTLFPNELLKIVLPRRMVTRGDFMPAALIVLRSYCYFLFTKPTPIML